MPARCSRRRHWGFGAGLHGALAVRGARGEPVLALGRLPGQPPLAPIDRTDVGPESGFLPGPVVDPHLDAFDAAAGLGPCDATDRDLTGVDTTSPRSVDAGLDLHGRLLGPTPGRPIGLVRRERRERQPGDPLRRPDIAVEARGDESGRVAIAGGQWLAVHGHGDKRLAISGRQESLDGSRDCHAVHRGREHLVCTALHSGAFEQEPHGHTGPPGRPDVGPADFVAHAVEGDVALDEPEAHEFLEADRQFVVDHPVHEQPPRRDIHARDGECRVDSIEVIERGPQRAHSRDGGLDAGRQRRQGSGNRREGDGPRSNNRSGQDLSGPTDCQRTKPYGTRTHDKRPPSRRGMRLG